MERREFLRLSGLSFAYALVVGLWDAVLSLTRALTPEQRLQMSNLLR